MKPFVIWNKKVTTSFPQLSICIGTIKNVNIVRKNEKTEKLTSKVIKEVRRKYKLETLKNNHIIRAYRDFFWKLDIDPTKTRPSGEALLRRVLHGNKLPPILTAVDAYNLASLKTIIPISGFDLDKIFPPLHVRFSTEEDVFQGIGMTAPIKLKEEMLLLTDTKQVLCIYPHRDSDKTKIIENTKNILLIGYGAPKIPQNLLTEAIKTALTYIHLTCNGNIETINIFKATESDK